MADGTKEAQCIKCKWFVYEASISLFGTGLCRAPIPAKCGSVEQFSRSMDKDKKRFCESFKKGR